MLRIFLIFYLDNHLASCWSYTVIAIAIKSSWGNFSFAQTVLTSCRAIATTREHWKIVSSKLVVMFVNFSYTSVTNNSWVQVKVSHKHWPNCTVSRWATHSLNASLLRKHQGWESLPLPGNCATSGGRESYSSSTSSGCSPEALWVCKMQMLSLTSSNSIVVFSKHQLQDTGGK